MNFLNYDTYFFDFDGVISDSNQIKFDAFDHLVSEFPEDWRNKFKEYHLKNLGVNRVEKFKWFYSSFIKGDHLASFVDQKSAEFREYTLNAIIQSGPTPGLLYFLNLIDNKKKIIVSGANTEDIIFILKHWDLFEKFYLVLGGEKSKLNHLKNLDRSLHPNSVFFGDANSDYEAALSIKSDFVFVYGYTFDKTWSKNLSITKIKSFNEAI